MNDIEKSEMLLAKARFGDKLTVQYGIRDERRNKHFAINGSDWRGNLSFSRMIYHIYDGFYDLRFDRDRPWDYPPETREGMPVWGRLKPDAGDEASGWMKATILFVGVLLKTSDDSWELFDKSDIEIVAADPRNLQEPPPTDWTPGAKRTIE